VDIAGLNESGNVDGIGCSGTLHTRLNQRIRIFAINVLSDGQEGLAQSFGFRSGRKHDKFQNVPYFDAPNGSPVLKDAMAFFEWQAFLMPSLPGDHSLFIGHVVEAKLLKSDQEPLIFRWDDYF